MLLINIKKDDTMLFKFDEIERTFIDMSYKGYSVKEIADFKLIDIEIVKRFFDGYDNRRTFKMSTIEYMNENLSWVEKRKKIEINLQHLRKHNIDNKRISLITGIDVRLIKQYFDKDGIFRNTISENKNDNWCIKREIETNKILMKELREKNKKEYDQRKIR